VQPEFSYPTNWQVECDYSSNHPSVQEAQLIIDGRTDAAIDLAATCFELHHHLVMADRPIRIRDSKNPGSSTQECCFFVSNAVETSGE
jgi:hypothetical protein